MDTTAYIQQQINSRFQNVRPKIVKAQAVIPEKERSVFMQKFLGFCIIFVAVATMLALVAKGMGFDIRSMMALNQTIVEAKTEIVERRPTLDPDILVNQDKTWMQSVDTRLDKLTADYQIWRHRVWLLSIAQNENANISKTIDQKYHHNADSGFIVFDNNWKINKMPETMSFTPEQKEQMRINDIK